MAIKTFTTGEVLTASDTNTFLANSGLVYITEAAFSTTALDGIFTSTYDNYCLVVSNMITTGANGLVQFKYRDTANATVSLTNYFSATLRFDSTAASYNYGVTSAAQAETGVNLVTTGQYPSFSMDIYGPRLSTVQTTSRLTGVGAIGGPSNVSNSSLYNATTAMAGIIFNMTAGTISGGRVYVYGYRKA
jgi:hypothetical protein